MSYFSKFPTIVSQLSDGAYLTRDFTRRITLAEKFQENSVALEDYFVLDGETPEMVSYKMYENPMYHWVIFIVNNIVDPREEWPKKDSLVIDEVYLKYDFIITVPNGAQYSEDDELISSNNGKFLVSSKSGNTIYIRSQVGHVTLTTSQTLTNITTDVAGLTISSVVLPDTRIHHYYDTELEYIVDNDVSNPNIMPVTNFEYEMDLNDKKRTVKVLNPSLLNLFMNLFKKEIIK